jgi:hypothetical protein
LLPAPASPSCQASSTGWSLEGDRIEICDVSGDLPTVQVGLAWRKGAPLAPPALNFIRSAQSAIASR